MEITTREIIASISIIAILLIVGIVISGRVGDNIADINEKYYKALKVDTKDVFQYGMDTSIGDAFVHGNFEAVDPVVYPEVGGDYLYLRRVKERYTMHTRTVTTTVNGKTRTRTQTYWTWDVVGSEEKQSKEVSLLGIRFNTSQFNIPHGEYITTIKESSHVRYKYYGYPAKSNVTIFTRLSGGNIESSNIPVYKDLNIEETIEALEEKHGVVLFWVFWSVITWIVVFGFYYLDNNWLNK